MSNIGNKLATYVMMAMYASPGMEDYKLPPAAGGNSSRNSDLRKVKKKNQKNKSKYNKKRKKK